MRLRWLLALGLVLLPCLHRAAAVRPSDLPSSQSGELANTCSGTSNPQTVPFLSASPVVQLTPITAKDSNNVTYTVSVAAYNYGYQDCTSSTPKQFTGTGANQYTILLVSVVGPSGAVTGLGLSSFEIQLPLANPVFFYCGNDGYQLCDMPPSGNPNGFDALLQPAASPGADGSSTVWSFGAVYDSTKSTYIILNSNYSSGAFTGGGNTYNIFGGAAVLAASGAICSGSTTGCNNLTTSTPFSVTFVPPPVAGVAVAPVTATSSGFTAPPATTSPSTHNLQTTPITVSGGILAATYNTSANDPIQQAGVPYPATINSVASNTLKFTCASTSLQQYLPVWFSYTPTVTSQVILSTAESHYDTVLGIPAQSLCNDNTTSTTGIVTSNLTFSATQGTTYLILAMQYPPQSSSESSGDTYIAPLSGDSTLYFNLTTPQLNYTPTTLTAFASTVIGQTSAAQTVTLSSNTANFGSTGITSITAATTGDFKVTPTSCTTPLPDSGPACPLSVTFVPTAAGTRSGTLVISSSGATAAGNTPITIQLSGTGAAAAPAVGFSPATTLTFTTPQVLNTTSSVSDAILTNTGTGSLTVTSVVPSGDFSQTNNCATVSPIAANGTCTIMVTFTPTAAGTRSGQLTVTDNAANSPQTLALSGTGILPAPTITFSVANQTYGAAPFSVSATSNSTGAITYSIVSGNATISGSTVTLTGIGPVVLQASQAATAGYAAATQNATFTVAAAAPTITFFVANQIYGAAPFVVSAPSNSTGAITFSVVSGNATISGTTVTLTGLGSVTLQASQAAAGNYTAGTQTATFTISAGAPTITFTVPNQTYGAAPFSVSATSNSTGAFTYSVVSGPATVSGSTVTLTGVGSVTLQASQAAAGNFAAATQTATFTVAKPTPAVAFTASPNPILIQNTLTLTATVASPAGTPTGTVAFTDGTNPLGTATLTAGVATLTVSTLAAGSHSLSAVYSGDGNFNIASATYAETVEDFTLTTGASGGSQTVAPGGTADYSLPMAPSTGTTFPAAITFSTSGVPTGFTATFNPASLPAGSAATNVALMIQVPTSAQLEQPASPARTLTLVAFALLLPFLTGIRRAHPRLRRLALAVVLLTAAIGAATLTGCGGGGGGGGGSTTPTPQTYTITVTATSGSLSHSTTVTLIVN